jgi:hypothetical protein
MSHERITEQNIVRERKGASKTVIHCEGAKKSLDKALDSVKPSKKRQRFLNFLELSLDRLANGDRLAGMPHDGVPDNQKPVKEGALPGLLGHTTGHFWAIKKIPIRGYGWDGVKNRTHIYISHYVYKDQQSLSKADTDRVHRNFRKMEN